MADSEEAEGLFFISTEETVAVPWTMPVKTATGAQIEERLRLLVRRLGKEGRRSGAAERPRARGLEEEEEEEVCEEANATTAANDGDADADADDADLRGRIGAVTLAPPLLLCTPLLPYEQLQAAALEREAEARISDSNFRGKRERRVEFELKKENLAELPR